MTYPSIIILEIDSHPGDVHRSPEAPKPPELAGAVSSFYARESLSDTDAMVQLSLRMDLTTLRPRRPRPWVT
jgi:hypothetical protein